MVDRTHAECPVALAAQIVCVPNEHGVQPKALEGVDWQQGCARVHAFVLCEQVARKHPQCEQHVPAGVGDRVGLGTHLHKVQMPAPQLGASLASLGCLVGSRRLQHERQRVIVPDGNAHILVLAVGALGTLAHLRISDIGRTGGPIHHFLGYIRMLVANHGVRVLRERWCETGRLHCLEAQAVAGDRLAAQLCQPRGRKGLGLRQQFRLLLRLLLLFSGCVYTRHTVGEVARGCHFSRKKLGACLLLGYVPIFF